MLLINTQDYVYVVILKLISSITSYFVSSSLSLVEFYNKPIIMFIKLPHSYYKFHLLFYFLTTIQISPTQMCQISSGPSNLCYC